jgi:phosphate-selective porin OprO and OprP
VTGPTSGTSHALPQQMGATGRIAYQVLQSPDYSLHVGFDAEGLLKPATSSGVRTLTLSDRPELRIDTASILSTGSLGTAANPVDNAAVYGVELAGTYDNLFVQSEGFNYNINRQGLPGNSFWGG